MILLIASQLSCKSKKQQQMINKTEDGKYSLSRGNLTLIIDPNLGARVISAKFNNHEILLQERDDLVNWGSTLWPAPQSRWNWPPPAAMHIGLYASKIQGNRLVLESETDTTFGLRTIKTFSFDDLESALAIEYQIFNDSDSAQSVGLWEISCVPGSGIVFFPFGEIPGNTVNNLDLDIVDGIGILKYEPEKFEPWHKVFNNAAEGWLAHVNDDNILFIKSFEKVPSDEIAPGQGNVEVYVSKPLEYIELENHGSYRRIPTGGSHLYKVKWYFRKLPTELSPGDFPSKELISYVKKIIKE